MKSILAFVCAIAFAAPAFAGAFDSVEDRAAQVRNMTEGNHTYHAYLARKLADVAEAEKSQHDIDVARQFMDMAEAEAAKAGGAK